MFCLPVKQMMDTTRAFLEINYKTQHLLLICRIADRFWARDLAR